MTSGSEWQDPFLVRPDRPVKSGKPVNAPPPAGPRFEGAPPSSYSAPPTRSVDPTAYGLNAPPWYSTEAFSRTWKVTFRRWGRMWLAFAALGVLAASLLSSAYPSPVLANDGGAYGFYFGTFLGLALSYLVFVGWWLDHVLASSGWVPSLVVQAPIAGLFGLAGGMGEGGAGNPEIGFPLFYLALVGIAAVALGQVLGRKVEGSFKPTTETSYSPPFM